MINSEFEELQRLRKENENLKGLIKEGHEIFNKLDSIINIKKMANMNFLFASMGRIIRTIQNNPDLIEEIIAYIQKLKKYENS